MAVVINTVTNLEKLSLINSNFTKLAQAINESLVWRNGITAGETQFTRDLDLNGYALINAYVDGYPLKDIKTAALAAPAAAAEAEQQAQIAAAQAVVASAQATVASEQAIIATNKATELSSAVSQVSQNTSDISALTLRVTAEEQKVQSVALGGTGASNAVTARANLSAASSGANTDITSITGSAASLTTARTFQTNLASTATASFNGTSNVSPGVTGILPIANGGTGNTTNLAASATILATARTVQTNLSSTASASFNGSANISPGVTGTLPIANGGTGATTASTALAALGGQSSVGVTNGSEATTGTLGEYQEASASGVALVNATAKTVASVSLTAGDWDVQGVVMATPTGATMTGIALGVSTTNNTLPASSYDQVVVRPNATGYITMNTPHTRINLTATTTVYIIGLVEFSSGSVSASGRIRARRVR